MDIIYAGIYVKISLIGNHLSTDIWILHSLNYKRVWKMLGILCRQKEEYGDGI